MMWRTLFGEERVSHACQRWWCDHHIYCSRTINTSSAENVRCSHFKSTSGRWDRVQT